MRRLILPLLLGFAVPCFADQNLALLAKATASDQHQEMTVDKVNDGNKATRWSVTPKTDNPQWLELTWTRPVTIGEVVINQYAGFIHSYAVQIWRDGAWVDVACSGSAALPINRVSLTRITPVQTTKVRIHTPSGAPSFNEVEVYENPYEHPVAIEAASDIRGNLVGIVTDTLGASPVVGQRVTAVIERTNGSKTVEATTDDHGMFVFPLGVLKLDGTVRLSCLDCTKTIDNTSFQQALTPISRGQKIFDLTGKWQIRVTPETKDYYPDMDGWKPIDVPSHWEMKGFKSVDGKAEYLRTFDYTPQAGKRTKLRFDGVYSGADVYLNGAKVATHIGGFTPFEADVTTLLKPKGNRLLVKVSEHTLVSDELDKGSMYADFPLAGIFRKVYLFDVSPVHVEAYEHAWDWPTSLKPKQATASGSITIVNQSDQIAPSVTGRISLVDANGKTVASSLTKSANVPMGERTVVPFELTVDEPKLWNAEQPNLYTLQIDLIGGSSRLQRLKQRVGIMKVRIDGEKILVNDQPVKFRGTCHHDTHPIMGRAVTDELTLQDMKLIKEANLNSVRTSHYPSVPILLDIADELGLYVEDEASFCWTQVSDDLRTTPRIVQLTAELLARDRNHPSVFMWSLCNESEFEYAFERSYNWAKKADPSRPAAAATSKWLDIATLHNPLSVERIKRFEGLGKPLLFDESLCIFQGIFGDVAEMWVDPGIRDYYAQPLLDVYKTFMESQTTRGSQIWCWADDIFNVPGRGLEYGRAATRSHFLTDQYQVGDSGLVGDAPWGVVDGWRRKKPEFWITRKLHSPIKISEQPLTWKPGESLTVEVKNEYDFLNLSDVTVFAIIEGKRIEIKADIKPQSTGRIVIPSQEQLPAELRLEFIKDEQLVDSYLIPVSSTKVDQTESSNTKYPELRLTKPFMLASDNTHVLGQNFALAFDHTGGFLRQCVVDGKPMLLELPAPHLLPTSDPLMSQPWRRGWRLKSLDIKQEGEKVTAKIAGSYDVLEGQTTVTISPDGMLNVQMEYTYTGKEANFREIGIRFSVPRTCDVLSWNRKGEWNIYPDDHIGRPKGVTRPFPKESSLPVSKRAFAHDPSPMGSNDFRSTKRHIYSASISYPNSGPSLKVISNGSQHLRAIVETDRISVHVNDWFGGSNVGWGEWTTNYGKGHTLKPGDVIKSSCMLKLDKGQ